MSRSLHTGANSPLTGTAGRIRLGGAAGFSLLVSVLLTASAGTSHTDLGAPLYWPWLLTGLQVLALWSAGTNRWWGWLLGAALQPPWVAYALVTGQLGFIQLRHLRRRADPQLPTEDVTGGHYPTATSGGDLCLKETP